MTVGELANAWKKRVTPRCFNAPIARDTPVMHAMEPNRHLLRLSVMATKNDSRTASKVQQGEGGIAAPVTGADGLTEVSSRSGAVTVTCTAAGLPVRMRLSSAAVRRTPTALAREILALCQLARTSAGLQARSELSGQGVTDEALSLLGLPSRQELVAAEAAADASANRGRR